MKICTKCKVERPLDKFRVDCRNTKIRKTICIPCNNEYSRLRMKNYYIEHKEERKLYAQKHWYKKGNNKFKKDHCEACSFKPEHTCQLDLDHIDGNKYNNDPSNHQTLCANCHRLKTLKSKNHKTRYK